MVKSRLKSWLSSLLLAMMATGLVPMAAQAQDVTYLDQFGETKTLAAGSYTTVTNQLIDWNSGWYVVSSDVTFADTCVTVYGTVHLILTDGATLTVHKGITLEVGNELDIYCQSGGTGALTATSENAYEYHAGIGGRAQQSCGKLVINGGVLNISPGEYGAGIGGGGSGMSCGDGGDITINGGSVTVTTNNPGSPYYGGASAIGGGGYYNMTYNRFYKGSNGGTLTIRGGNVHLTANEGSGYGSAVGPGYAYSNCKDDATLILDWTSLDDRIYMSKVKANVTMNAPFKNADTGEEVTASDNLNGITLAPLFVNKYTVSFMLNGEEYNRQIISENHVVEEPDAPNVEGWLFLGWFEDGATEPYDFSTPITGHLTLYAHMVQKSLPTDGDGAYLIGSALDWRVFTIMLSEGIAPSDANAKLTADITEPVTYMMETTFGGTFDGQGHTITVDLNITENAKSLFCSVNGATITNLTVAGTINTSAQFTGGLIGTTAGSNNNITNCVVSATMNGTYNGHGYHGGFLGSVGDAHGITFTNCVFDGNMYGPNTNEWSGFIGKQSYSNNNCFFVDCFFVPGEIDVDMSWKGYTYSAVPKPTNCYYAKSMGYNSNSSNMKLVATVTAGERVTISDGTPSKTYKNVDYYASPATFKFAYDLPEDKIFFKYSVNTGTLSAPYTMDADEQRLRDFDGPVIVTGSYIDSLIDISTGTIDSIPDMVYTSKAQIASSLVVHVDDNTLSYGYNYQVAYENNINAGVATVILTGCGPYTGTLIGHFNILPRDLSADGYTFTINPQWGHTGEEVHPKPTVTHKIDYSTTYTLVEGVDYELTYSEGCIEPGEYTVTIHGIGNYGGTHDLPFEILGSVPFLSYDSITNQMVPDVCENYRLLMRDVTELTDGWYVAKGNVKFDDKRVTVTGDVHLILMDGATYNPRKGITVQDADTPNSLTIYAQSEGEQMGQLLVDYAQSASAGIGGERNGNHGIITINGGHITTKGATAAGIGSGYDTGGGSRRSQIYIHGGIVDATGGASSAGIGAGCNGTGGRIFITGGTVNATGQQGNYGGAGIGGSGGWPAMEVNISGGTVVAKGGYHSPGIGGGADENSVNARGGRSGAIHITGGDVTAIHGDSYDVAIGAADNAYPSERSDTIELRWTNPTDRIKAQGKYTVEKLGIYSVFLLEGTSTLATVDNINNKTIVAARAVVIDSVANGTVTADKTYLAFNTDDQIVTVTVTPDEGYILTDLNVVEAVSDTTVTLNKIDEGSYSFEMPTNSVTVTATFVEIPEATTVAEILSTAEADDLVVVANDLAIVDVVADQHIAFATDGEGNWIELSMDSDVLDFVEATPTLAGTSVKGKFIYDGFNPTIVILEMPEAAQNDLTVEPAVYPVNLDFAPKPCEVFYVTGYYHSSGGSDNMPNLREWSGNGGQMGVLLDLDLSWARGSMEDGKHYKIRGTALLKEAWEAPSADGIRPRMATDDPMALRNYTIMATDIPDTPTAIERLLMDSDVKSLRYFNLQGIELASPADGVNIVVIERTDGTYETVKIRK